MRSIPPIFDRSMMKSLTTTTARSTAPQTHSDRMRLRFENTIAPSASTDQNTENEVCTSVERSIASSR
ncbi:hypothetical protein D3C83_46750 [compost metagenome]